MGNERKAETYLELNGKYLREAEELISKGDYVQASEKLWGAAAEMVKAVAMKRDMKELGEHRILFEYVSKLDKESTELNLKRLFMTARLLHTNFYEDELSADYIVGIGYKDVIEFINKMRRLLS